MAVALSLSLVSVEVTNTVSPASMKPLPLTSSDSTTDWVAPMNAAISPVTLIESAKL